VQVPVEQQHPLAGQPGYGRRQMDRYGGGSAAPGRRHEGDHAPLRFGRPQIHLIREDALEILHLEGRPQVLRCPRPDGAQDQVRHVN
jgi:hypothetical protein